MNLRVERVSVACVLAVVTLIMGCNQRSRMPPLQPSDVELLVLYDVDPRAQLHYSNLLTEASSYPLSRDEVIKVFANTTNERLLLWKGSFLGVAQCKDGKVYHLAISYYGGYARVLETGQSLRFVGPSGAELERILRAALDEVFVPERRRRNSIEGG